MLVREVDCEAMSSQKAPVAVSSIPQDDSVFGRLYCNFPSFLSLSFFILCMSLLKLNIFCSEVQESRFCPLFTLWMTWDYMCPHLHIAVLTEPLRPSLSAQFFCAISQVCVCPLQSASLTSKLWFTSYSLSLLLRGPIS